MTSPGRSAVAEEALRGGVDWIEAGTPLIKSEGLEAVREMKRRWPDRVIVADLKTMDAGRFEMESAAKAGARVAGVLGAASDATIAECIEVARKLRPAGHRGHDRGCRSRRSSPPG